MKLENANELKNAVYSLIENPFYFNFLRLETNEITHEDVYSITLKIWDMSTGKDVLLYCKTHREEISRNDYVKRALKECFNELRQQMASCFIVQCRIGRSIFTKAIGKEEEKEIYNLDVPGKD